MTARTTAIPVLCLALACQGCSTAGQGDSPRLAGMGQSVRQIASQADGRVGAAVCLIETGQAFALAGDERFPMQSVYKVPIALALLHEVDAGGLRIDQVVDVTPSQLQPASLYSPIRQKFPAGARLTLRQLIGYAVSQSDNVASDILLGLAGGPERVTARLRSLGIDEVTVATTERQMDADPAAQHRNWATPRGAVGMLAVLHAGAGLSPASQAVLREAMVSTVTGPGRIKGLLPPGTVVAHKTGTSGTLAGRAAATNDIGIVTLADGRHLAVAVFVADSAADLAKRESVIARIARAAYDGFVRQPARPAPTCHGNGSPVPSTRT
jgi:beta-lactamase class A